MSFVDSMLATFTENGALSHSSSGDSRVDLFFKAVRGISEENLFGLLERSYSEHSLDTRKMIFYLRDCRGGQGEKKIFYRCMKWLYGKDYVKFHANLFHIPEYGSWKDIFQVLLEIDDVTVVDDISQHLSQQLQKDYESLQKGEQVSLLAKWLPSENSYFDKKLDITKTLCRLLGISKSKLRKEYISPLRKKIDITESYMCSNRWSDIEYSKVPSVCMHNNKNLFEKHDKEGFDKWISLVKEGKEKVNAKVLMVHQLIEEYEKTGVQSDIIEEQWNVIVNDVKSSGVLKNTLVVCDVSGSMTGLPMNVCKALGLLISEISEEPFHNYILTFHDHPQFFSVGTSKASLFSRFRAITGAPWGMNTNIQATFDLILDRAKMFNLKNEDLPKKIIILSDMQFDEADKNKTNLQTIKEKFNRAEYTLPQLVFWNLRANTLDFPSTNDDNLCLISGFNQSLLKCLMKEGDMNPVSIVKSVIDSDRYSKIC